MTEPRDRPPTVNWNEAVELANTGEADRATVYALSTLSDQLDRLIESLETPEPKTRWEMHTAFYGSHTITTYLEQGWQPFAVHGDRVFLRREVAS